MNTHIMESWRAGEPHRNGAGQKDTHLSHTSQNHTRLPPKYPHGKWDGQTTNLSPDFQDYEPSKPTYQSDYPSHYPSSQSHPYQTCPADAKYHFPTWLPKSSFSWSYQYRSYPQQDFEPPLDIHQYENSIEGKIEGLIASQQSIRSCLKSNDELASEMQIAHDEHKASMDEMIKQASLLDDIMKRETTGQSET